MAGRQGFPKTSPDQGQVVAKNRRVPRIYFGWQGQPAQPVLVKKMGVLGTKLHRVPKKGVVPRGPGKGGHAKTIKSKYGKMIADDLLV